MKPDHYIVAALTLLAIVGVAALVVLHAIDPSESDLTGHLVDLLGIVLTGLLIYVGIRYHNGGRNP